MEVCEEGKLCKKDKEVNYKEKKSNSLIKTCLDMKI